MEITALEKLDDLWVENLKSLEEAKAGGAKVVGWYCTYGPQELAVAAGAYNVGLCGTREDPIPEAEKELPRILCPLIKSSYGFALTGTCPFLNLSDLVVGETTCDGKKKMFELLAKKIPTHVMQLPQTQIGPEPLEIMHIEIKKLKKVLEEHLAVEITDEALGEAIILLNKERRILKELFDLNHAKPALITGMQLQKIVFQQGFYAKREDRIAIVQEIIDEIKEKATQGYYVGDESTPRIILTGTPTGVGSEKVIEIVEECGGLVLAFENCTGYKTLDFNIDEDDSRDKLLLLAERYLKIPCSIMTPNLGRLELLEKMVKEFKADGVIDLTWQACHTYNIEATEVGKLVKEQLGKPYLHIETDYSQSDVETLRVRINAFLEMIQC